VPPIAVLSDIHGNRQALDAVRGELSRRGITRWWCVGDLVGYGADPGYVIDVCRAEAERCVSGNHDLVVAGRVSIDAFADWARDAAIWSTAVIGPERREWLGGLHPVDRGTPVSLAHASLRDPVWEYVNGPEEAAASLELASSPWTLIGHTHVPALWHRDTAGAVTGVPPTGSVDLAPGEWLINPGSVGQPRDGDPRASWVCLEIDARRVEFVRTPYDVTGAQAAIRAAGLPALLSDRLAEGY
jgi:diadenosine tetraphosphatase ApaH/serine/threonine PP2A family protein phosphatase